MEIDLLRSAVKYTHTENTADQACVHACVCVCVHMCFAVLCMNVCLLMYFYATDLRVGIYV